VELLHQVAEGNQKAFRQVVEHYTPVVFQHLLTYVKNVSLAEELTQDIFLSIWRNREKLAGMENFSGYVYVSTRNRTYQVFRNTIKSSEVPPHDMLHSLLDTPEKAVELKELVNILHKAIDQLPPRRKEVFMLSRFDNLTYEEIAAQLGISRSAVNQHISEAIVFLRTYLKEEAGIVTTMLLWMWLND
jgi:RNA polymerase sigma-70 factor (family 1)